MSNKDVSQTTERGQTMVEIAVSMVLLLTLLSGVVELGRVFYTYIALREAAWEGAAYGALCPNALAIESRVRQSAHFPVDLKSPNVAIYSTYIAQPGTTLSVKVEYNNFVIGMPFLGAILGTQTLSFSAGAIVEILNDSACP